MLKAVEKCGQWICWKRWIYNGGQRSAAEYGKHYCGPSVVKCRVYQSATKIFPLLIVLFWYSFTFGLQLFAFQKHICLDHYLHCAMYCCGKRKMQAPVKYHAQLRRSCPRGRRSLEYGKLFYNLHKIDFFTKLYLSRQEV